MKEIDWKALGTFVLYSVLLSTVEWFIGYVTGKTVGTLTGISKGFESVAITENTIVNPDGTKTTFKVDFTEYREDGNYVKIKGKDY